MELCELHLLPEDDTWPSDIDTRIAQLDFGGDSALFASSSVSTDSLDSEQLRERCRLRTEDFQLTFADSGHWQSGQLTTWGRIRSTEPLEENTASAPDVTTRPRTTPSAAAPRPTSLLANFVGRESQDNVNGGRYVDVNDNEIQLEASSSNTQDRWRAARPAPSTARPPPVKPRRTFADLHKSIAPELQFLALPHQIPTLCESSTMSLSDVMLKVQREGIPPLTSDLDLPLPSLLQTTQLEPPDLFNIISLSYDYVRNNIDLLIEDSPDSGLGCSGPVHIEDWASLSILLPKHVAEACSFFKSNAQLLGSSSHSNCIERKRTEPCRTCFRVRRRIHPPSWAHSAASRHVLCDCSPDRPETAHELMPRSRRSSGSQQIRARELSVVGLPIYSTKRTMVEAVVDAVAAIARGEAPNALFTALAALVSDGLNEDTSSWSMIRTVTAPGPATKDVYSIVNKLDLSEKSENSRVEQFFEELFRENSLDCWLCYVVLKENVLRRLYTPGSFLLDAPTAYRTLLWRLVDTLAIIPGSSDGFCPNSDTKNLNSFLVVLEVRECSHAHQTQSMLWSGPCRLPADSRVPKSSSVPARLSSSNHNHRRSRIPLPKSRLSMHRTLSSAAVLTASPLASVIADSCEPGQLVVSRGESVRVLSRRGPIARCCRVHRRRDLVSIGIVPLQNLLIR
ncbi:RUN domain protein [Necator americanus]|uniref:RUN domain protein n=1 Tax=Necator americanus TaxID=51031 RepID=W2T402_NECAM|nr:RUN domain protein [Necator americanus]ETN75966.1 RUN domain protein [Necator americanus]